MMESIIAASSETRSNVSSTILSALQQLSSEDALTSGGIHPFASNPEDTISTLRRLVQTTNQAALSLNAHLSLPLSNPKLLSLYRQHASIASSVQQSEQTARHMVNTLRKRVGIMFGEGIPLERQHIIEWFLERLTEWGKSAGMETFKEEQNDRTSMVLGGKVLVVDIDFAIDRTHAAKPTIDVATLKTAYAIPNSTGESSSGNSVSLDGFLAYGIRAFAKEVQKDDAQRDSVEAARLGSLLSDHLSYLMKLDHLALTEGDGGLRWFSFIDKMALEVEKLANREAAVIQKSEKGVKHAPLDVFLLRAHALPLPYLTFPSISFLTYLSPLAYLKLLRISRPTGPPANHLPNFDIPFHDLRSALSSHPRQPGMTVATLILSPNPPPSYHQDSMSIAGLDARASTTLVEDADKLEFVFPAAREAQGQPQFSWLLDFTEGGKYPGVVMSQSRMRDIEMVVNPFGGINHMNDQILAFGTGSWVDLLFNPQAQTSISPERYTALHTSPTYVHPPLQLRLTTPDEPGFILETVPVRTLKEVWSILEIVREQCWLNEILLSCQWVPEGLTAQQTTDDEDDVSVTDDDLLAVLKGSIKPHSIPVNIRIPQPIPPFSDTADMGAFSLGRGQTCITMTTPERPPVSGLVEITVTFDATRARGVAVDIVGAVGVDFSTEVLEEVCRRGGLLGLPGRVWVKAHQMP